MKTKYILILFGGLFFVMVIGAATIWSGTGEADFEIWDGEKIALIEPSIEGATDDTVTVSFEDASGNPITSINRGESFVIWAQWQTPINGYAGFFKGRVTWSGGVNTIDVLRTSNTSGVFGTSTWMVAPIWASTGPVEFVASIKDRGRGHGTLTMN
ncbi:MAG: hypothetical protein ACYTG7_04440 [Planctomycetota bacterium]|jgi:hypothetical protein